MPVHKFQHQEIRWNYGILHSASLERLELRRYGFQSNSSHFKAQKFCLLKANQLNLKLKSKLISDLYSNQSHAKFYELNVPDQNNIACLNRNIKLDLAWPFIINMLFSLKYLSYQRGNLFKFLWLWCTGMACLFFIFPKKNKTRGGSRSKDFFSNYKVRSFLLTLQNLLKKTLIENFIFVQWVQYCCSF